MTQACLLTISKYTRVGGNIFLISYLASTNQATPRSYKGLYMPRMDCNWTNDDTIRAQSENLFAELFAFCKITLLSDWWNNWQCYKFGSDGFRTFSNIYDVVVLPTQLMTFNRKLFSQNYLSYMFDRVANMTLFRVSFILE